MSQLFVQYVTKTLTDTNDNDPLLNLAFVQGWCMGRGINVPKDIWRLLEADIKKYNLEAKGCWEEFKMNPIYFIDYWYHNKWQQKHNPLHVVMPGPNITERYKSHFVLLPLVIETGSHPLRQSNKKHWGYITHIQSGTNQVPKNFGDLFLGFRFKNKVESWILTIRSYNETVAEYNNKSPELNNLKVNILTSKVTELNNGIDSLDFYNPNLWDTDTGVFYYLSGLFPICKLATPFTEIIIEANIPTEIELLVSVLDINERRSLAESKYSTPNGKLFYGGGVLQKIDNNTLGGVGWHLDKLKIDKYHYQQGIQSINEYFDSLRNPHHFNRLSIGPTYKRMYLPPHLLKN